MAKKLKVKAPVLCTQPLLMMLPKVIVLVRAATELSL